MTEFVEVPAPSPMSPGPAPRTDEHESQTSEKAGESEGESEGENARSEEDGDGSKSSPLGTEAPGKAAGDGLHGGADVAEGRGHSNGATRDGDAPTSRDATGAENQRGGVAGRGNEPGGQSKEQDHSPKEGSEGREKDSDEAAGLPRKDDAAGGPGEARPSSSCSSSSDRGTGSTNGGTETSVPEDEERTRPPKASAFPQEQRRRTKVPRVVTRMRTWPLRIEQTYTGMLQGAGLEVSDGHMPSCVCVSGCVEGGPPTVFIHVSLDVYTGNSFEVRWDSLCACLNWISSQDFVATIRGSYTLSSSVTPRSATPRFAREEHNLGH